MWVKPLTILDATQSSIVPGNGQITEAASKLACEQQTYFRSSLLVRRLQANLPDGEMCDLSRGPRFTMTSPHSNKKLQSKLRPSRPYGCRRKAPQVFVVFESGRKCVSQTWSVCTAGCILRRSACFHDLMMNSKNTVTAAFRSRLLVDFQKVLRRISYGAGRPLATSSLHSEPTQSVCVADCYFKVNVLDLPFASPVAIYR